MTDPHQILDAWLAGEPDNSPSVTSPADVLSIIVPLLDPDNSDVERFCVVGLNRAGKVIDAEVLSIGNGGHTIVDPSVIYRWALTRSRACTSIVVAHNHPGGNPTPSPEDQAVTERLAESGAVVGIRLLDHVVVGHNGQWKSMAELGMVPGQPNQATLAAGEQA